MSAIKVYISPYYDDSTPDRAEGGIRRVVESQVKHLRDYGVKVVQDINKADIYNAHVGVHTHPPSMPLVHSVHGLHWSPDYNWHNWAHEVNKMVVDGMVQADAITAVSHWVRDALVRGMYCDPKIIYHGVDPDEWAHDEPTENYVLWNKARRDPVSNDADLIQLAELMPSTRFVSTISTATRNISSVGVLPLPILKGIIQRAGVYLATARETFGVGTLEALASGVPVVGWDYGGQSEIIKQGETGYLAPYGNYEALAECVNKAMTERGRLSVNAIADVRSRWLWPDKIEQYANLYRATLEGKKQSPKVTVLITCHNLAHYLPDSINSVRHQPFSDWEVLIVDDDSTDDTARVAIEFTKIDNRIRYLKTPRNLKLSMALNFGAENAKGQYLVNLDADNMLGENALEIQAQNLDAYPDLHIVYGMVDTISRDGSNRSRAEGWPFEFEWRTQMAHLNCIQSSAMHRKSIRLLSGGYRERMWRAEDGEFWARVTSYGARARKVTEATTLIYRNRGDSKSSGEYNNYPDKDGDWVAWFPWRTATNAQDGVEALRQGKKTPNAKSVPYACSGKPEINNALSWNAPHHQHPLISVIIPVGPGHQAKVIDALDSLQGQALTAWEAVVVNDTGDEWDKIDGALYARVISTGGTKGAGYARNLGVKHARGKLIWFLDADDYAYPVTGLRSLLTEYAKAEAAYIYSDHLSQGNGIQSAYQLILKSGVEVSPYHQDLKDNQEISDFLMAHEETYSRNARIRFVYLNDRESFRRFELPEYDQRDPIAYHAVNILIAKKDFESVGGFDETMAGWEDWDLFCKLAVAGLCGKRVPTPCFIYREHEGKRRNESLAMKSELLPILNARYNDYYKGQREMAGCGCGAAGEVIMQAKQAIADSMNDITDMPPAQKKAESNSGIVSDTIRMEFIGPQVGAVTFFGTNGRQYKGGNNPKDKYENMANDDADKMESTGLWRKVKRGISPDPAPQAESVGVEVMLPPVMVGEPDKPESFLMPDAVAEDKPKKKTRKKKAIA